MFPTATKKNDKKRGGSSALEYEEDEAIDDSPERQFNRKTILRRSHKEHISICSITQMVHLWFFVICF
jgi:hypothetical protein